MQKIFRRFLVALVAFIGCTSVVKADSPCGMFGYDVNDSQYTLCAYFTDLDDNTNSVLQKAQDAGKNFLYYDNVNDYVVLDLNALDLNESQKDLFNNTKIEIFGVSGNGLVEVANESIVKYIEPDMIEGISFLFDSNISVGEVTKLLEPVDYYFYDLVDEDGNAIDVKPSYDDVVGGDEDTIIEYPISELAYSFNGINVLGSTVEEEKIIVDSDNTTSKDSSNLINNIEDKIPYSYLLIACVSLFIIVFILIIVVVANSKKINKAIKNIDDNNKESHKE